MLDTASHELDWHSHWIVVARRLTSVTEPHDPNPVHKMNRVSVILARGPEQYDGCHSAREIRDAKSPRRIPI
jgi:hypothetical protein